MSSMSEVALMTSLFAMVFAAAGLCALNSLGVVARSSVTCAESQAGLYSGCEMWQDARSIMSFMLGALCCGLMQRHSSPEGHAQFEDEMGPEKLQLTACLL